MFADFAGKPSKAAIKTLTELAKAEVIGWTSPDGIVSSSGKDLWMIPSPALWKSPRPAGVEQLTERAQEAAEVMHYALKELRGLLVRLTPLANREEIARILIDWQLSRAYINWSILYEADEALSAAERDPGKPYRPNRPARRRR